MDRTGERAGHGSGERIESPEPINFREIMEELGKQHKLSETLDYIGNLLSEVNRFYEGIWSRAELPNSTVRHRIILMRHGHVKGQVLIPELVGHKHLEGQVLVPETGSTVAEASARFRAIGPSYVNTNRICYDNIQKQRQAPFSPIILASANKRFRIPEEYQSNLIQPAGSFLHLDGLHRLIAWDLEGRFKDDSEGKPRLKAYIAGPI